MSILKQSWTLILYGKELELGSSIVVAGDEFHYLINVLRLKENDSIEVSNGIGTKAIGFILKENKKNCEIQITHIIESKSPKRTIHLMLAHLKPSAMQEAIFVASELGVNAIHLFPSERASLKHTLKIEKLQKIANEAVRISKSAYSAKIFQYDTLDECTHFLCNKFDKICFLFCDENSTHHIAHFKLNDDIENVCIIIGPEASFSLSERTKVLQLKNCYSVSLGSNILRTQTAITCASFTALKFL